MPALAVDLEPVGAGQKEISLAVIASVVGIVAGSMQAAEQIRQWSAEWRAGKNGKKLDKVVVVGPGGRRYLLHEMSKDEIAETIAALYGSR